VADEEILADEMAMLREALDRWTQEMELERELEGLTAGEWGWVSLAEAEQQAQVSRSTLRAWYRTGQIPSRLMPGPHGMQRLVPLHDVLERANRPDRPARVSRRSDDTGDRSAETPPAQARPDAAPPAEQASAGRAGSGQPPHSGPEGSTEAVIRLAELAVAEARDRAAAAEARADRAESALHAALERAATAEAELRLRNP
jgi:hypothetical protein